MKNKMMMVSNWIYDERSVVKDADVAQLVEELAPPLASNGTLARHFCWGLILATTIPILCEGT